MRSTRHQGEAYGLPVMKFTLTYEGSLPASGNKPKNRAKWDIRKAISPQLADLWAEHPALKEVAQNGNFPLDGAVLIQGHHNHPGALRPPFMPRPTKGTRGLIDLNAPIIKHGRKFLPLVRENYALHCGLKILFLRREPPGRVYQGGDIDGRLKTLMDALAMPQHPEQVLDDPDAPDPMCVLLEDDVMVSGLHVETERLLAADNFPSDYARLTIEVDVRVRRATIYNQSFLG